MEVKDALELYENGKHRRYGLLFSVNGGAFAIAQLFTGKCTNVLGGLTLKHLSIGMILFTLVMVADIFAFGWKMRGESVLSSYKVFGYPGIIVLLLLGLLICMGWRLVGFD